jgi:hypothetical protein
MKGGVKMKHNISPIPVSSKVESKSFIDNGDGSINHYLNEWLRLKRIYQQGFLFQGEKKRLEKEIEEIRLKSRLGKYLFLDEYNLSDDDLDVKVNGKQAHYSHEYCRLLEYHDECQIGEINDPVNLIIRQQDKSILKNEMEEALRLSKSFF